MNFKSRVKLFFSIIAVLLLCGGLALYVNYSEARIGSNNASLQLNSYAVGTEYNGTIIKQYAAVNDHVVKDEPLFEFKSDVLNQEIASGQVRPASLSYKLDPATGALVFTAQRSGVVTQLNYAQGSFVSAGKIIAMISDTSDATLNANFYLSGPEYNRLSPTTPAIIHFPGGKQATARIAGITQFSQNGRTITTVRMTLANLDTNQTVYGATAPLSVDLELSTNPLYDRLSHNARVYLHSL